VPASIRAFDGEMKPVKIGLSKPSLFDLQQLYRFKFLEIRADTAFCGSHVLGEPDLAGKAGVVVPRVFEKHGVGELRANRNIFFCEKEIRDLGKAVARRKIGTDYLNVSLFENVADVALAAIGHMLTLYASRKPISPLIPFFWRAFPLGQVVNWVAKHSRPVELGRDPSRQGLFFLPAIIAGGICKATGLVHEPGQSTSLGPLYLARL
jgi:hypothetical protein